MTAFAAGEGRGTLLSIADLHSAYARLPQLLSTVRRIAADAPGPVLIVLNGDLFERGNVVAARSRGAGDFAFLTALGQVAPTILNIGNHEPNFVDDMRSLVAQVEARGVPVISNIVDARTGRLYAPLAVEAELAGRPVMVAGIATDNIFTYPANIRSQLTLPEPVASAQNLLRRLGEDPILLLSHAGVVADRAILPLLTRGSIAVGGHDHLTLTEGGGITYAHGGSWGRILLRFDVTAVGEGFSAVVTPVEIAPGDEGDAELTATITALEEEHLTAEDKATIATLDGPLDFTDGVFVAVEAVRKAADADVAFIGHTTFGTGLPAGNVRRYDFDAFIRFDGSILTAQVRGATLAAIMGRANQHEAATLEARTGDFVYAREIQIDAEATYTIAVNGWTARNQEAYLGTQNVPFREVPGMMLKSTVMDALNG
ncbi:MAG: metallophosphoesterase [Pseudomonadota bacterium]